MVAVQVLPFRDVVIEIEEFTGEIVGGVTPLFLEPVGFAIVVSVWGIEKNPTTLSYGEFSVATVMYGEVPHRVIGFSPQ